MTAVTPTMLVLDAKDGLLALVVDSAGDVEEVDEGRFEEPPATLKGESRRLIRGACKLQKNLMLVLDADHVFDLERESRRNGSVRRNPTPHRERPIRCVR